MLDMSSPDEYVLGRCAAVHCETSVPGAKARNAAAPVVLFRNHGLTPHSARTPVASAPAPNVFPGVAHDISATVPNLITTNLIEKSPKEAASALVTLLTDNSQATFVLRPTSPHDRLNVIQRMIQYGTPAYLASFTNLVHGREILATWLLEATPPRRTDVQDTSEMYTNVVGPLLELLLRLPIELDHLKDHVGLGKLITGAQKRLRNERARKLADAIKEKWSALVPPSSAPRAQTPPAPAGNAKRPASSNDAPDAAAKRARGTTPVPARTTVRPTSSLLGSSTAKTRTQTERRGSPQLLETSTRNTPSRSSGAQSNANKDLASFMTLIDQRQPSPPMSNAAPTRPTQPAEATGADPTKKRKKSVHWKDHDGQTLVAVKLIEPAIYDEDEHGSVASIGQLDMEEGGAFRLAHADMEEYIDYYTPYELDLSPTFTQAFKIPERAAYSEVKFTQEEYEQTVPEAVYADASTIPESPAEPTPDEYLSAFATTLNEPRDIPTGSAIRPFVFDNVASTSKSSSIPGLPSNLADLLQQLNSMGTSTATPASAPVSGPAPALAAVPPLPPSVWGPQSAPPVPNWPFPFPPPEAMTAAMQATAAAGGPPPVSGPPESDNKASHPPRSRGGRGRRSGRQGRSS